jgi:hypothetical protein
MTPGEAMEQIYNAFDGSEMAEEYSRRHGIESAAILTVTDDEMADLVASHLHDRVQGKTVVEIGGGIGLLALHLSAVAKHVYVIEANPAWTWVTLMYFYANKPKNVTFIFGAADEVAGQIRGDVALFCTHSAATAMRREAAKFAPEVIDVYGEVITRMDREHQEIGKLRN